MPEPALDQAHPDELIDARWLAFETRGVLSQLGLMDLGRTPEWARIVCLQADGLAAWRQEILLKTLLAHPEALAAVKALIASGTLIRPFLREALSPDVVAKVLCAPNR